MKKIVIPRPGGYEQLQLREQPDLSPGPGQVLVAVAASGINYADCIIRMGLYESARHYVGYPITPGFDVAGTVAAVGDGVDDLAPGTPVLAVTRFDGYASRHLAPLGRLVIYGFHSMLPKGRGRPNWVKLVGDCLRLPFFNPLRMTSESRSVLAFNLSFLFERRDLLLPAMRQLLDGYQQGNLHLPKITPFPTAEVAAAQRTLESGETVGKLVLTWQ
jgi:NADPH:quinone reductase-like Zn-dependent oxidoreductase